MSSAYIALAQIKSALPEDITAQLLDDTGSGVADAGAWSEIVATVKRQIDAKVGMKYALPLAEPVPAVIVDAAFVLAAELCYKRKGYFGESNPWTDQAESIRGTLGRQGGQAGLLDRIASGEVPLVLTVAKATRPAAAIVETAKTSSSEGWLMT